MEDNEQVEAPVDTELMEIGEVKKDTHGSPFGWFLDGGYNGHTFA